MFKTIDIIVPIFNEEKTLVDVVRKLEQIDFCGLKKRLILVDDASIDSSREILKSPEFQKHLTIFHETNGGKGSAIISALKHIESDIVVIQDADLEYNPQDYNKLLPLLIEDSADVVYGSRLKDNSQRGSFLFLSYVANTFLTCLTNILYGCKITDMETCYKAFKREILDDLVIKSSRFDFEPEITAKVIKKGARLKEVPITYNGRKYHEGKKVKAKDALHAIFTLFYYRFFD